MKTAEYEKICHEIKVRKQRCDDIVMEHGSKSSVGNHFRTESDLRKEILIVAEAMLELKRIVDPMDIK